MKITLKKFGKVVYSILLFILLGIAILTLLSALGIPRNAQIYVVETGSMEPTIPTGSLVFVSPQSSYQVGDVITYKSNLGQSTSPKTYNVTHRITSISTDNGDTFYQTEGDANTGPDPWTANNLDVLGKVTTHIPYLGYIIGFAKTKLGFIFFMLMPTVLIIYLELMNITKVFRLRALEKRHINPRLHFKL